MPIESYTSGIERAVAEGHIDMVAPNDDGSFDRFSHISLLTDKNTRKLDPTMSKLLQAWPGSRPKFLELGPGAGVATSAASIIAPNGQIHTAAGLTPINPYWRFHNKIAFGEEKDAITIIQRRFPKEQPNLDKLRQRQETTRVKIFNILEVPYIHAQHVGPFQTFEGKPGDYNLVYESCGPNWHTQSEDVLEATLQLIGEEGILSMNSTPIMAINRTDIPYIVHMGMHTLLISRGSFLAAEIKRHLVNQRTKVVDSTLVNAILDGLISKKKAQQSNA